MTPFDSMTFLRRLRESPCWMGDAPGGATLDGFVLVTNRQTMDPNREIELKLSIDPTDASRLFELPILRAAAIGEPEVQSLHTIYYDGRDLPLAAAGISLRLRRAAGRQWQTVKLEGESAAGLFARAELEVELPGGSRPDLAVIPDEAVRERVVAILGDQPLLPIFETEMERTSQRLVDGKGEWTIGLDRGEVRAGFASEPICEVELELHRGPASHLFEIAQSLADVLKLWPGTRSKADRGLALHAGLPVAAAKASVPELEGASSLRDVIVLIARSCLAQIAENSELAYEGRDPEGVHQMRVGLRRLRALVALARRAAPSARLGRLRASLRWLAGLLGDVRDLDVLIEERIDPLAARRPGDAAFQGLREDAAAWREERRRTLREALRSRRHAHLILELGHWVASLEEMEIIEADAEVDVHADGEDRGEGDGDGVGRTGRVDARVSGLARPVEAFATSALVRLEKKVRKRGPAAIVGSAAARHALRIALKKLRYSSEFFRSLYGEKEAKKYWRRLSRLQDLLGVQNDAETAGRLLKELLERCPPEQAVELARAAGFIEGYAAREQERALHELAERWEKLAGTRPFWVPK
jgi:triphosphatase